MKASIKLVTTEKATTAGFPIYIFLRDQSFPTFKKVIGHCKIEDWNPDENIILKSHPNYNVLMPDLLDLKSNIAKINLIEMDFDQAKKLLVQDKENRSTIFYEAAVAYLSDEPKESVKFSALNSFNKFYPGIEIDAITAFKVSTYMDFLLKLQKPNGVHTYLRTLAAIFRKVSDLKNPFDGIRPKKERTPNKALTDDDLQRLFYTRSITTKYNRFNDVDQINAFRYYYMLLFYLGGIDLVDLAKLRYDVHVFGDRVKFQRSKGATDVWVNNKIFPAALKILKKFDCYPYLVPIYNYTDYRSFRNNMNRRLGERVDDLMLTQKPLSKSARYSFINRAQQLLIDERITKEIVGHSQKSVHSIYTDEFPLQVRDDAHLKIISLL